MRPHSLVLAALALASCGGSNVASQLVKAPDYAPANQTKCSVARSQAQPLIVEWPSADRGELEASAHQGVVVVRYQGCEMQVLPRCRVPEKYGWTGTTRKKEHLAIHDADSLYANLPLGAASLEGKLEKGGELDVDMTIVGRWQSSAGEVREDELDGDCMGATHVVTAITAGAFKFSTAATADVHAGAKVAGFGAGGESSAKRDVLNEDGLEASCEKATATDTAPPEGCGAMLRVEVTPLSEGIPCPPGTTWNGSACRGTAKCPRGTMLTGGSCAESGVSISMPDSCSAGDVAACGAECQKGSAEACAEMGFRSEEGDGVPKDEGKAMVLLRKSCDAGVQRACNDLGGLYIRGTSIPRDMARGATLMQKACDGGWTLSCYNLALLRREGEGIAKDEGKATLLLGKACDAGVAASCWVLGRAYASGSGVTKDIARATALFKRACDRKDGRGCAEYGHQQIIGEGTPKDAKQGFEWSLKACTMGNALGCSNSAAAYFDGKKGGPRDITQALLRARQGCNGGSAVGCRVAGVIYEGHDGVAADGAKAADLLKRACTLGDEFACARLKVGPASDSQ